MRSGGGGPLYALADLVVRHLAGGARASGRAWSSGWGTARLWGERVATLAWLALLTLAAVAGGLALARVVVP